MRFPPVSFESSKCERDRFSRNRKASSTRLSTLRNALVTSRSIQLSGASPRRVVFSRVSPRSARAGGGRARRASRSNEKALPQAGGSQILSTPSGSTERSLARLIRSSSAELTPFPIDPESTQICSPSPPPPRAPRPSSRPRARPARPSRPPPPWLASALPPRPRSSRLAATWRASPRRRGSQVGSAAKGLGEALPMEMDIDAIMKLLPHRYPFLLVDRVLEIEQGKYAIGEERHHQRQLLPRPLPPAPHHARRAHGGGHGAGRRPDHARPRGVGRRRDAAGFSSRGSTA